MNNETALDLQQDRTQAGKTECWEKGGVREAEQPGNNERPPGNKEVGESWKFQVTGWIHLLMLVFSGVASPSGLNMTLFPKIEFLPDSKEDVKQNQIHFAH